MPSDKIDMFSSKVDKRSRAAMVHFLENHFRYYTANSWNRSTSYANNVKIHNLPIPDDLKDLAYDIAFGSIQSPEFEEICNEEISNFFEDTGYHAAFNGRSGGYLVMYDTQRKADTKEIVVLAGRPIDQDEDFNDKDEWPIERLRERVILVERFDTMCMNILARFITLLQNSKVETRTYLVPHEYRILVAKDAESETT